MTDFSKKLKFDLAKIPDEDSIARISGRLYDVFKNSVGLEHGATASALNDAFSQLGLKSTAEEVTGGIRISGEDSFMAQHFKSQLQGCAASSLGASDTYQAIEMFVGEVACRNSDKQFYEAGTLPRIDLPALK